MVSDAWSSRALLAGCAVSCVVAAAGCGGSSSARTGDAGPALRPSGPAAQLVRYQCVAGRRGTISVELPNPRRLAEVLNPINVCEFDGGLAEVSVALRCSLSAPEKKVRIVAVQGQLPASAAQAGCD